MEKSIVLNPRPWTLGVNDEDKIVGVIFWSIFELIPLDDFVLALAVNGLRIARKEVIPRSKWFFLIRIPTNAIQEDICPLLVVSIS